MVKKQIMFTFPQQPITETVIYELGRRFNVVTNIRRADVTANKGWVVLELEGLETDINKGIEWVTSKGVRVDPVIGNIVEA